MSTFREMLVEGSPKFGDVVECLVEAESFEEGFDNLVSEKAIKALLKDNYSAKNSKELDDDTDGPDGPFENYPNVWFKDISKLNAKKTFSYLMKNYKEDIEDAQEYMK